MKFYEFLDKDPAIPQVVLVEGTERLLAERAIARVVDRVLPPHERDLNLERIDLATPDATRRVAASIAALPFLGSARVVVARGAQECRVAARRELVAAAETVPLGNVLVIEDRLSPNAKRPEPLAKSLGRGVLRIDTSPVAAVRDRFVRESLAELGASAEPAAIAALTEGDVSLASLRTDLEKLALLGRTIRVDDVLAEILVASDAKAYQYAKAVVAGETREALRLAHELFAEGGRGAAVPLFAALATEYALVWEAARPGGRLPSRAAWREREIRPLARRLGERRARAGFEFAVRGFEAVVTGRSDDARLAIEIATTRDSALK